MNMRYSLFFFFTPLPYRPWSDMALVTSKLQSQGWRRDSRFEIPGDRERNGKQDIAELLRRSSWIPRCHHGYEASCTLCRGSQRSSKYSRTACPGMSLGISPEVQMTT